MGPAVKERPILFSASMIRAILDGRKTQTRREISKRCRIGYPHSEVQFVCDEYPFGISCPFGKLGDRLWVRETHRHDDYCDVPMCRDRECVIYAADHPEVFAEAGDTVKWRPSIHMPRWASRITLEITDVRVEQLNEISGEDAIAEGIIRQRPPDLKGNSWHWGDSTHDRCPTPITAYRSLWESINGKGSWQEKWVWVISFKRVWMQERRKEQFKTGRWHSKLPNVCLA